MNGNAQMQPMRGGQTCRICRRLPRCRSIPAGRAAINQGLTIYPAGDPHVGIGT